MSEIIYIQDDFGNRISLLDEYGNLSVQVLMLYTEDKLTEADRKTVNDFAETDEIAKDALEGFSLTLNPSKTRYHLGQLNAAIQKRTGAAALTSLPKQEQAFDNRKLAAAIALLVIIGGATFFGTKYFGKDELAVNTKSENVKNRVLQRETVQALEVDHEATQSLVEETKTEAIAPAPNEESVSDKANVEVKNRKQSETRSDAEAEQTTQSKSKVKDKKADEKSDLAKVNFATTNSAAMDDAEVFVEEVEPSIELAQSGRTSVNENADQDAKEEKQRLQQELMAAMEKGRAEAEIAMASRERNASVAVEKREELTDIEERQGAQSDKPVNAQFPGGDMAMYKFIQKKKVYTDAMKAQGLTGTVTVIFDVEADGRVANARIKTGANGLMNEDALRVVRSMPNWSAAKDADGNATQSVKAVVVKYGE